MGDEFKHRRRSEISNLANDFIRFFSYINSLRRLPEYKYNPQFKEILEQAKKFDKYEKMLFYDDLLLARPCRGCGQETIVYNSRTGENGEVIRWRKCLHCGAKHRTVELYDGEIGK